VGSVRALCLFASLCSGMFELRQCAHNGRSSNDIQPGFKTQYCGVLAVNYHLSLSMADRTTSALHSIHKASSSLLKCLGEPFTRPNPPSSPSMDYSLPAPLPIITQLIASGLGDRTAAQVSSSFITHALAFKASCESKMRETCRLLAGIPSGEDPAQWQLRIRAVFARQYHARLEQWKEAALSRTHLHVLNIRQHLPVGRLGEEKTLFNQVSLVPPLPAMLLAHHVSLKSAIPILEYAFGENPSPSGADRDFLAKLCSMTRRQIDVWVSYWFIRIRHTYQ
jgi:hypothetical protein